MPPTEEIPTHLAQDAHSFFLYAAANDLYCSPIEQITAFAVACISRTLFDPGWGRSRLREEVDRQGQDDEEPRLLQN